jgi:DNA-directed RNA polymerase specialized sigma24 family protein
LKNQTLEAGNSVGIHRAPEILVERWLGERDAERALALMDLLIGRHAEPLVRRIVRFKLGSFGDQGRGAISPADIDDVCGTALCDLLARLDKVKAAGTVPPLRSFSAYVAVTAYNACNDYFRAKKPAFHSLAMRMRYVATHSTRFALWQSRDGQDVCGLANSMGQEPATDIGRLTEAGVALRQKHNLSRLNPSDLIETVLRAAGAPLFFEHLLTVAAEWSDVKETRVESLDADFAPGRAGWERVSDGRTLADAQMIDRQYMLRLWKEICALSLEHRKALLLNLKDSAGGDIQLFDYLGIATVGQIATVLEMDPHDFADLWNKLPLDDACIADELGISRQDVSNRRSSARKRLARRMSQFGEPNDQT